MQQYPESMAVHLTVDSKNAPKSVPDSTITLSAILKGRGHTVCQISALIHREGNIPKIHRQFTYIKCYQFWQRLFLTFYIKEHLFHKRNSSWRADSNYSGSVTLRLTTSWAPLECQILLTYLHAKQGGKLRKDFCSFCSLHTGPY